MRSDERCHCAILLLYDVAGERLCYCYDAGKDENFCRERIDYLRLYRESQIVCPNNSCPYQYFLVIFVASANMGKQVHLNLWTRYGTVT